MPDLGKLDVLREIVRTGPLACERARFDASPRLNEYLVPCLLNVQLFSTTRYMFFYKR